MKKTFKIAVLLVVSLMFLFSVSCELLLGILFSVSGNVVNVKATASGSQVTAKDGTTTLTGTTVTFTNVKDASKTKTATVGSDGSYSLTDLSQGKYRISASKTGWTFIPIEEFDNNGLVATAPDLLAFPTSEAGTLTAVMQWQNRTRDVDFHMTWGTEVNNNPNHLYYATNNVAYSGADTVSFTGGTANLDRDVTKAALDANSKLVAAESITLTATATIGTVDFRFFLHDYGQASGLTGLLPNIQPAGAKVHLFKGTEHYGSWTVPFNTAEQTLRIFKISFDGTASNGFTVYTDIQTDGVGVYRGLNTIGTPVNSIQ